MEKELALMGARLEVTTAGLTLLYKALARTSPVTALSLRSTLQAWRQTSAALPAQYQQALNDFLQPIEAVLPE